MLLILKWENNVMRNSGILVKNIIYPSIEYCVVIIMCISKECNKKKKKKKNFDNMYQIEFSWE